MSHDPGYDIPEEVPSGLSIQESSKIRHNIRDELAALSLTKDELLLLVLQLKVERDAGYPKTGPLFLLDPANPPDSGKRS